MSTGSLSSVYSDFLPSDGAASATPNKHNVNLQHQGWGNQTFKQKQIRLIKPHHKARAYNELGITTCGKRSNYVCHQREMFLVANAFQSEVTQHTSRTCDSQV